MNEQATVPNPQPLSENLYISTRQDYDHAELEVSGRYDTWILTLAGGALGLSITFMEKIAPTPIPDTLIWLKFSWSCFVAALFTALTSLVTSQSAIRENRKELDKANEEARAPCLSFPRRFTVATNLLNWISLVLFIMGVALLCAFSFKNIGGSPNQ